MGTLPYLASPGNLTKALDGIKTAAVPPKVSQDFVKSILKITGSSGDQMTSFLKKIGFASTDGSPTDLYLKFRNPTTSGFAAATALKQAYAPLYRRNEYAHALEDKALLGLILEETGQARDAPSVKLTSNCFKFLRSFASFEPAAVHEKESPAANNRISMPRATEPDEERHGVASPMGIGLNLGYTININLPATSDQAVFNAIFRAIKQNLMSGDDG